MNPSHSSTTSSHRRHGRRWTRSRRSHPEAADNQTHNDEESNHECFSSAPSLESSWTAVSSLSSRSVASKWHRRRMASSLRGRGQDVPVFRRPLIRVGSLLLLSSALLMVHYNSYDNESGRQRIYPEHEEQFSLEHGLTLERRALSPHLSYFASFTHDNSLSTPRDSGSKVSSGSAGVINDKAAAVGTNDVQGNDSLLISQEVVKSSIQVDSINENKLQDQAATQDLAASQNQQEATATEQQSSRERQDDIQFHRILQEHFTLDSNDGVDIPLDLLIDETASEPSDGPDLPDKGSKSASNEPQTYSSRIASSTPLPQYTLQSALKLISLYRTAFALLIYDPASDQFFTIYSKKHFWTSAVVKMNRALTTLTHLIRLEFNDRLQILKKKNQELVIAVSGGDYPLVRDTGCVRENLSKNGSCVEEIREGGLGLAPILHFGSVFRRPMYPNMIAMPPPESHHLNCFEQWAVHTTICPSLRAKSKEDPMGELIYAKEFGIKWKDLKNQLVWRGTDFGYLGFVHPTLMRPKQPNLSPNTNVRTNIETTDDDALSRISHTLKSPPSSRMTRKEDALAALKEDYNSLVPRWKGVVITAEAEVELQKEIEESARGKNEANRMKERFHPWINIKFSQFVGKEGVKAKTLGSREYRKWEKINFPAVGENMGLEELAKYKYHIDLGGGGGTTWSGTIHKLAFPGLLFHHVTPTKDYFHDWLQPWKHFVPVDPNLNDLKEKYDWAQSHPKRAFQIARNGSELMRFLSSPKGMEKRYQADILDPLRAVMDAYVPLSQTIEHKDKTWKAVLVELEGAGNMLPIQKCTGHSSESCEKLVGKEAFLDRQVLRRVTNSGFFESKETESSQGNRQLMPWAHEFFVDINKRPDTDRETALFWHIPKSGGTTVKNLYQCTGQTLAHRGGVDPKFGHDQQDELVAFKPHEDQNAKFVNVDTTIKEGILRGKEMGLVQSHITDIIFTMEPTFAGQNLYDKKNKGRILALFRHPVERMVSKFYYLQIAHWERGYRPDWANLSLMEWIQQAELKDDNLIVRKLAEKSFNEQIDETDLMRAKALLRRRVIVGLMNEMEESVHRFNIVLGINESLESNQKCMSAYFDKSKDKSDGKKNSNKHPKVVEGSPEWKLLAEKEWLDMRLYAYAQQLFEEQKETIYSYQ